VLAAGALLVAVIAGGFFAWSYAPSLPAVQPPAPAAFASDVVARGASLAAMGDCIVCHTAVDGKAFAGGRPIETPFGVIYGTNITPDPDHGIGRWSEAAFVRAMREGLDRAGRHLYPAFPYDHFRVMGDDDLRALYAFVMTRTPVAATPPANRLRFPFNVRPLVAGWKALYLDRLDVPRDGARDLDWQRGAYLVTGVAHCGACHTPRNRLGAEDLQRPFEGGEAEGWDAPALGNASPAPVPWTADALHRYLRGELAPDHGVAAGPMAAVATDLVQAPDRDVRAIATYVASLGAPAARARNAETAAGDDRGRAIYDGACASCHEGGRDGPGGALALSQSSLVALPSPRNLFRVILHGLAPVDGERGVWMPAFAGALDDAQVTELANYLRTRLAGLPAWGDVSGVLHEVQRTPDERAVSGGP
jgi:mono/diheme cytochrome c family protein